MIRPFLLAVALACHAQTSPSAVDGDWVARDFQFESGEKLAELRLHYATLGTPVRDSAGRIVNAVLIMHGTGGTGGSFLGAGFGGVLFGPGQPLDANKYFIILPDAIGHGKSSKPSDGLHMNFPRYCYHDMVRAQELLVRKGLGVDRLRLVMGTSMGAMHSWLWGEMYPDSMDALMPLASATVEIAGRNRMMRAMIMQAIRGDPDWRNGEYAQPPANGLTAAHYALWMMTSSPLQLHKANSTRQKADEAVAALRERALGADANDMLYHFESSGDYNPNRDLEKIRAPLFAVNSADDEVNPPELGILERDIQRVKRGRYILLPTSDETRGHGTHSRAAVWKQHLVELLRVSEGRGALLDPKAEAWTRPAPAIYRVRIATTKGDFVVEARRALAPIGADRFYQLVKAGFFDDSRFYRVVPGFVAQFGIPGDPLLAAVWRNAAMRDDPSKGNNLRGTIAFAMTGPDLRTTQLYINLTDNARNDEQGFAPFAKVVEGMDVVDQLYGGYGEASGGGMRAGKQDKLFTGGNTWLDAAYPKLDRLLTAIESVPLRPASF